jgi:hypothetical protein
MPIIIKEFCLNEVVTGAQEPKTLSVEMDLEG